MTRERYLVYQDDCDGTVIEEISIMADCHRQHIYTETTLVGVSHDGARRLAQFVARTRTNGRPCVSVPGSPLLVGWELR